MVTMQGEISLENINKIFLQNNKDYVQVLKNISVTFPGLSFISLIGPSGCGKSTLLRIIAGLLRPDGGKIFIDGKSIKKPCTDVGLVFQEHALFPWLNVRNNIAFGLKRQGLYGEYKNDIDKWIKIAGLSGFEKYFPHQISQGMCQRVSFARALICRPSVLLFDEPLGALDAFTRMRMQDEILKIRENERITMVMVTHDVDEAIYLSDKVIILSPRPAQIRKIVDIKTTEPRVRNSNDFIEYRNQILETLRFNTNMPDIIEDGFDKNFGSDDASFRTEKACGESW